MGEKPQTDEILDFYDRFRCKQQLLKQSISLWVTQLRMCFKSPQVLLNTPV